MGYIKLFNTADMTREEWLQKRRELGIGGSEMAAIMGYSKWASPIDVWLDKCGNKEPIEENEYMYWGNMLEEVVAQEFSKRTGIKVRRNNFMLQSQEWPWLFADIDRELVGVNAGLECKTGSAYIKDSWDGEDVPDNYYIQCQHYMAVTDKPTWWIAILLGGNTFVYKEIPRNEEVIKVIVDTGKQFWDMVQNGIMPAVDGSEACTNALKSLHQEGDGSEIELPDASKIYIEQYLKAKTEEKEASERKTEAQNALCNILKKSEVGVCGIYTVKWGNKKGRELFDTKRFRTEHPQLAAAYTAQGNPIRVFSIK